MNTLTITGLDKPLVQLSPDALRVKLAALDACRDVVSVGNRNELHLAKAAYGRIREIVSDCERSKFAAKEQVLQIIREIDDTANVFASEPIRQRERIGKLIGEYNAMIEERERVRPMESEVQS